MNDYKRGLSKEEFKQVLNDCLDKVNGIKDIDWQEIVDKYNLNIHKDVLRKAFQSPLGGYAVYQYVLENNEEYKNSAIVEIERAKIELEKEKIKLQDQRRDYKAFIRQEARWEHLEEEILKRVELIEANPEWLYNKQIDSKIKRNGIACALMSDFHYGMEVDTYFNKYNTQIFNERLGLYINNIIRICVEDSVKVLNIELLGDLISGLIHLETRVYNQENVIDQTIECAELVAQGIAKIANNFINKDFLIKIYIAVGNHGRVTANYKEHIQEENFEYLIKWILRHKLKNFKNVMFMDNAKNPEICEIKVFGKNIVATHGDKDKANNAVKDLSKFLGYEIDEVHLAHYHKYQYINNTLVNGCLSGSDVYAQRLRYNDKPCQVVKVYYDDGATVTHEVMV